MATTDSKQITVLIAGRPYPLKIKANDEAAIRKIVKEVNEKINRFQLAYTNRDKQDCLAMTALALSVDLHKSRQAATQTNRVADQLNRIDEMLDQILPE
jgi:cell division protein ZapA (FtsZ GTPase activity inhibitor)